jgi:hypothetical protein
VADTDASIIYCDNGLDSAQFCAVFEDVVKSLAFRPVHYSGVGVAVRTSNQDKQLRDDFYEAIVAVIRLAGNEPLDNWAVPEFNHCQTVGKRLLVYLDGLSAQARSTVNANITTHCIEIGGIDDFRRDLPESLRRLLSQT